MKKKTIKVRILMGALMILVTSLLSACSSFSLDGMWQSSGGTIVTFNDGSVSPTLFGFSDGPQGSYALSEKPDDQGHYTLVATHLTGGTIQYQLDVEDQNHISLILTSDNWISFAPKELDLERK